MQSVLIILLIGQAALSPSICMDELKRLTDEPVLAPSAASNSSFDSAGVFNPAVVFHKRKFVMLYRAQDKSGRSSIASAESLDGINFIPQRQLAQPMLQAATEYEKGGGLEDPRLTKIGKTFLLTYTAYNKKDAQLCLAMSTDLKNWDRKGIILPANKGTWNERWTKSGAILPHKVNNKYWMYYMGDAASGGTDQTGIACSSDLVHWTDATNKPVLMRRPGQFDSRVVEPGPPPILLKEGILLVYNGADDQLVYCTGWALFDKSDPTKLLARSDKPIFTPEKSWEKEGQVPNVVFVEGMVRQGKRYLLYFGGADKYIGVAESRLLHCKKTGREPGKLENRKRSHVYSQRAAHENR